MLDFDKMSLEFLWFCRQKNETVDYSKLDFVNVPKVAHYATTLNVTAFEDWQKQSPANKFDGCFGTGPGKLFGPGKYFVN